MAREFSRTLRIAEQIRRELTTLIQFEVKDPRVDSVSLTEVQVTKDLSHAKVYFTLFDSTEEKVKDCTEGLNRAAGFLRRALSQEMRMRTIPALHFHYDVAPERGEKMSALIDQAMAKDQAKSDDE